MADAQRIAVFGRSGAGKSTIADQIAAPSQRLIVFDYLDTGAKRARRLKLQHVYTIAEIKKIMAKSYATGFRIWYQPPIAQQAEALHQLSVLLWQVQRMMGDPHAGYPHVTLYVDEMKDSFPVYSLPANQRGFYNLCTAGRHMGVNLIGCSQRPAQVNTEFRGNLNALYLFSLWPEDYDAARKMGGRAAYDFVSETPEYRYMRIAAGRQITYGQTRK